MMLEMLGDHFADWHAADDFSEPSPASCDPSFSSDSEQEGDAQNYEDAVPQRQRGEKTAKRKLEVTVIESLPAPPSFSIETKDHIASKGKVTEEIRLDSFWDEWEMDETIDDFDSDMSRTRRRRDFPRDGVMTPNSPVLDSSSPTSSSATVSPSDWVLDFDDVLMMPESPDAYEILPCVSPSRVGHPGTSPRKGLCPRDLSCSYPSLEPVVQSQMNQPKEQSKKTVVVEATQNNSRLNRNHLQEPMAIVSTCKHTVVATELSSEEHRTTTTIKTITTQELEYNLVCDDGEDDDGFPLEEEKPNAKKTKGKSSDARKRKRCPPQILNKKKKSSRSKTKTGELEDLLFTISHLLPKDKLPGVIAIIPRQYCNSTDEGLAFDINALDKQTIQQLEEYVNSCLYVKPKTTTRNRNPGPTLKKGGGVSASASTIKCKNPRNDGSFLDTRHVFQVEQVVTIQQSNDGDEDEEVDIGDLFDA